MAINKKKPERQDSNDAYGLPYQIPQATGGISEKEMRQKIQQKTKSKRRKRVSTSF